MLNQISWAAYWSSIAFLTAAYYLIVYWRYFRNGPRLHFTGLTPGKAFPSASPSVANFLKEQAHSTSDDNQSATLSPEQNPVLASCIDELNAFFSAAKSNKMKREELLFGVQQLLKKYPTTSPLDREALVHFTQSEAQHYCSIQLRAEEIARVWSER